MPSASPHLRNILAYAIPELFWGCAWALTVEGPMIAAFSAGFGGSESYVGLVSLVLSLALGVPMLLTGFWVEPMRNKRSFVFWGHVAGALVLGFMALLIAGADPAREGSVRDAYLVGTGLFYVTVGLLVPGWLALVGELFPERLRARALGITFVFNRAGALCGGFVARAVLAASWSATDQWTLLFALAGALSLVGSLPFLWVVERARPRPKRTSLGRYLRGLVTALRELPGLRRFIAADVLAVTFFVTIVFYGDAAFRKEGFEESWAGTWNMVAALAMMVTSGLVAVLGERVAPRGWLALGACAGVVGALAAGVGGHYIVYGVAGAMGGVYFGVRASCHAPQVMSLAPGRDGTAPLGIAGAFALLVQGLGPFVAGHLIPSTGYPLVFAGVAVLCLASALLLLFWVPRAGGNQVIS